MAVVEKPPRSEIGCIGGRSFWFVPFFGHGGNKTLTPISMFPKPNQNFLGIAEYVPYDSNLLAFFDKVILADGESVNPERLPMSFIPQLTKKVKQVPPNQHSMPIQGYSDVIAFVTLRVRDCLILWPVVEVIFEELGVQI
jgi:hypothetical protein